MTLMQALAQMLWANAAFKAASPGGIMDTLLPESATLPATTYQVVGGSSAQTFETTGFQRIRVQFDCHGADAASTSAARVVLRQALEGFSGGELADGSSIQALFVQAIDFYDYEPRQFRKACEFYILTNSTN